MSSLSLLLLLVQLTTMIEFLERMKNKGWLVIFQMKFFRHAPHHREISLGITNQAIFLN